MKNILWLSLILLLVCMFAFSGCDSLDILQKNNTPSVTTDNATDPETDAHVHVFGEWKILKDATCIYNGEQERSCACGKKETLSVDATGHTVIIYAAVDATCTTDGKTEGMYCSACGETFIAQNTIPASHVDGEWIIDTNATCTVDGSKRQVCSVCNESIKTEAIAATGHTDGEWVTDSNATCTVDGSKHQVCSVCNESIKTEAIAATGHTDGEWVTDSNATCTVDGSKHQVCSVCNESIKTEFIAAPGHTAGEWVTDSNATCTVDGRKHQVCSVCNESIKTEFIAAPGHTAGKWVIDTNATCTENGSKHQVCSVCESTIKTETLTKLGHTGGQWITDKEATCIEYGSKHYTCSRCQLNIEESIPLKSHNYKGTTCVDCGNNRIIYNFSWKESYEETYNGYRLITIVVGEEYQLKYTADVTKGLFYDLSNWVFYEPYVVDKPSVISIDENGKITGLKAGIVGIKNTGYVINNSNDNFERRIYIQVISEYTETEYNDSLSTADVIKPGQTIKFSLSNTSDIDVFKFIAPSDYVKVICTYHGDYEGAPSGQARLLYVQILDANGTLMNSGSNPHDSAGNTYERRSYIGTSTGYIIFKFVVEYPIYFPSGYITIEIVPA